jgi:nucleoside-diphosphate-sugar epimerase
MGRHVVVGRGPVGSTLAAQLRDAGVQVRQLSRQGTAEPGVQAVQVDAADRAALAVAAAGAEVIYNCANPPYDKWAQLWPPLAAAMLHAAEQTGAVLVTMSNLYGYGPVDGALTEDLPLAAGGTKGRVRAAMWRDALAAHQAGRVRVTEARASDFYGPAVTDGGYLGSRAVPALLRGRPVRVLGAPDAPHTWSYVPDVARTLAVLATDERAWGRPWHVPSAPPASQREMLTRMAAAAGAPPAKVRRMPPVLLRAVGLVSPLVRELAETRYQFDRPFVLDSTAAQQTFGLVPTSLERGVAETVRWWQARDAGG